MISILGRKDVSKNSKEFLKLGAKQFKAYFEFVEQFKSSFLISWVAYICIYIAQSVNIAFDIK